MQEYVVKVTRDGDKFWYQNGKLHREDGPALEYANGSKAWYQNDMLHRLDGPAVEHGNGSKSWYQNGELHRLDGPAIECTNGDKMWYIDNVKLTEAEFSKRMNQKEMTVAEIATALGYEVKVVK